MNDKYAQDFITNLLKFFLLLEKYLFQNYTANNLQSKSVINHSLFCININLVLKKKKPRLFCYNVNFILVLNAMNLKSVAVANVIDSNVSLVSNHFNQMNSVNRQ